MNRLLLVALVVVAAGWPLSHARADARERRVAAEHFARGRMLYARDQFGEALDEFRAGYTVFPLAGFLVNIGQCQRKLDRLEDAAASFKDFLDARAGDEALRAEVREALEQVRTELSRRAQLASRALSEAASPDPPVQRAEPTELREPIHRPVLSLPRSAATSHVVAIAAPPPPEPSHWRRRWWAYALVAAGAGAVAVGVYVGVTESQPAAPHAGTLGLLDGRR